MKMMMIGRRIHSCDDLLNENVLQEDNDCFQALQRTFHNIKTPIPLGSGSDGAVFDIISRKKPFKEFALKLIPYAEGDNEKMRIWLKKIAIRQVQIACEVQSLSKFTSVHVRTLGYLICSDVPQKWKDYLPRGKDGKEYASKFDTFILMFMKKPLYSFNTRVEGGRYQFELGEYGLSLFFILLHSIYIGRKLLGFVHGDLAGRNILFDSFQKSSRRPENIIFVEVEGKKYAVRFYPGITPKLIDYGASSTTKHYRPGVEKRDLEKLLKALGERDDIKQQDWYQMLTDKRNMLDNDRFEERLEYVELDEGDEDWQGIAHYLQNADIFKNSRYIEEVVVVEKSNKKQKTMETCIFCHQEADLMFAGTDTSLKFCNSFCAEKIASFASFLPGSPVVE